MRSSLVLAVAVLALAACEGGSSQPTPPPAPPAPALIVVHDPAGALALTLDPASCTGATLPPRLRVARVDNHVDVIDAQGVPLAHLTIDATSAVVTDAGRAPVAALALAGDRVTVASPTGTAIATVTGTLDLEVAASLAAPGIPPDLRAPLACEKLSHR